jgi:hypothetical protein
VVDTVGTHWLYVAVGVYYSFIIHSSEISTNLVKSIEKKKDTNPRACGARHAVSSGLAIPAIKADNSGDRRNQHFCN